MKNKNRMFGFVNETRNSVNIYNPTNLREGQRAMIYIPTDIKIENPTSKQLLGYRNDLIATGVVKHVGKKYTVELPTTVGAINITSAVRKCRKFSRGDVIIQVSEDD